MPDNRFDGAKAPTCPGCHFGCRIDYYQCARGLKFLKQWEAGEEIPERRMPGPGAHGGKPGQGPRGGADAPALDGQVLHLLMLVNMFGKRATELPTHVRVAEATLHHDGFATPYVVAQRSQLDGEAFDTAVDQAVEEGLVDIQYDEHDREFICATDTCKEQADAWRGRTLEAQAAFLSGLEEDEKEQLRDLLAKVLQANRK